MKLIVTGLFTALAAAALFTAATANAEPERPANCTAADLAGVSAGVAASTSSYLFTHPDVNDFFTSQAGKPHSEMQAAVKAYFSTNPETENDLRAIRQPSSTSGSGASCRRSVSHEAPDGRGDRRGDIGWSADYATDGQRRCLCRWRPPDYGERLREHRRYRAAVRAAARGLCAASGRPAASTTSAECPCLRGIQRPLGQRQRLQPLDVLCRELTDHRGELVHGGVEDVLDRFDATDAAGNPPPSGTKVSMLPPK